MTRNLVQRRESKTYPGLFVKKYDRKVFYDNLWNDDLIECRGHVEDAAGCIVVRPFTKIFNRFENETDIDRDSVVTAVRKINGFMAAVTHIPSINKSVVSTTGSLDSPFVEMAKQKLPQTVYEVSDRFKDRPCTFMFEIVHEDDPHVIPEECGAYLIGMRFVDDPSGYTSTADHEFELDTIACEMKVKRPDWFVARFSDVVQKAQDCEHEGFVVYSKDQALKIKSPFYLTTKFLGRMGKNKLQSMAEDPMSFKQQLDEEFWPLLKAIDNMKIEFVAMTEQARMAFIRACLNKSTISAHK